MHQSVDHQVLDLHEQAEAGDTGHDAEKTVAEVLLQEFALEPVGGVARGLLGASLETRAGIPERRHLCRVIAVSLRAALAQPVLDRAMHEQVRVTPDR